MALHQVHVGDHFGDRVLHLDARIHLDEVELAVFVHEELDGSGIDVADFGKRLAENAAYFGPKLRRNLRRRRFFQQLLMAALDGALAFAQADHVAVLVGEHLEFDVPRPLDELLHVEVAVAEGGSRL